MVVPVTPSADQMRPDGECQTSCGENRPLSCDSRSADVWQALRELLDGSDAAVVALAIALI